MKEITYAAFNIDEEERKASSSGGIFVLLAHYILDEGGVVYGVAMNDSCDCAEYIRIDKIENLSKIMGSKYIQARINDTFFNVKEDLNSDKLVLFSGTGCQVNGLKNYLSREYKNLFCVDVVCHGVPSPKLWKMYKEYIEHKSKAILKSVNFRCKKIGWNEFGVNETFSKNKTVYTSRRINPYMKMFLFNLCLRPSCYECTAKSLRYADLTIADFWGIDLIEPSINDNKGVSMVIVRTKKGNELFSKIKKKIKYKQVDYEQAIVNNSAEYKSVSKPENRESFFEDMNNTSFDYLQKKYAKITLKQRIKDILNKFKII